MSVLLDLALDGIGLFCKLYSWMMMIWAPIGCIVGVIWVAGSGRVQMSGLVWAILAVLVVLLCVLFGLLTSWLGTGVLARKRPRVAFLAFLCLLIAIVALLTASATPQAAFVYAANVPYLATGLLLTFSLFRRRKQAP